jgi:hypothetical protein
LATKVEYIYNQAGEQSLTCDKNESTSSEQIPKGRVKTFLEAKVGRQLLSIWNFQDGVIIFGIKSERDCSRMIDLIGSGGPLAFIHAQGAVGGRRDMPLRVGSFMSRNC